MLETARELADDPRIDVLSITDNPGGQAMLAPDTLGTDLISRGQEVIIHLSCKDWNRNALESRGWKLGSEGFDNVLALSGDYPIAGHRGLAAPVFDIDSVGLLELYSAMNEGIGELDADELLPRLRRHEPQAARARGDAAVPKAAEEGAAPARGSSSTRSASTRERTTSCCGSSAASSFPSRSWRTSISCRVGRRARFTVGAFPGVVVNDELLALVQKHAASDDKGRAFFVDLAAKHVAVSRGLGFGGVYLGGHMKPATFGAILDQAEGYYADWVEVSRDIRFGFKDEFHLFEADSDTGLSSDEISASYLESKRKHRTDLRVPIKYRVSRRLHETVFAPDAPLFPAGRAFYRAVERAPKPVGKTLHVLEQSAKVTMFGCEDCGDCSLPDIAYVCPESQCAKNQRNGPCGGTRDGLCEVYDTECIWSQAYERLKHYGEEESMLDGPVIVKDNALAGTSAWANTFLGRDHTTRAS